VNLLPKARFVLAALMIAGFSMAAAAQPADAAWPRPEDVPVPSSPVPGIAGERPYDIVRFLLTHGPMSVALSPDGESVAYRSVITGYPQLFVMPARGGWPVQLTFGPAVTSFAWAPDSRHLLYAADRDGDEREGYVLISADGTRERRVSDAGDAFVVFGDFSPDGRRIAYSSTERNGTDFDVFVRDLDTGRAQEVLRGRFGMFAGAWQPGGDWLLLSETRGEDANDLHLLNVASGEVRALFAPDDASFYGSFAWLADGSGFYLSTNHGREYRALGHVELATGELTLLQAPDRDVEQVALFDGDRYLAWTENADGYSTLHVLERATGRPVAAPELPQGVYDLEGARSGPRLAVRVSGPRTPGEVWLWNPRETQAVRVLEPTLAGIDPDVLVVPESHRFEARDGVMLQGLLYRPPGLAEGVRPPLMLLVHGGPTAQARPGFDMVAQYLTGRGFAVFDLNFRGSTGFGKSFARLDNGRKRPEAVRDVEDAVTWLTEHAGIDPARMAIMGGSYGGYLTNAAVVEFPGLFRAAVSLVGVSDWVRALEEASPALKASDRLEYGDIDDPGDRAYFADISPIGRIRRARTPMVVVHGANDPRDPVSESDRLVRGLRDQEVEVRYLRFADEGHHVRKLGNQVTQYREIAEFLERQLEAPR